jgi:hypothetical protein
MFHYPEEGENECPKLSKTLQIGFPCMVQSRSGSNFLIRDQGIINFLLESFGYLFSPSSG